jgi:hypothetical protein
VYHYGINPFWPKPSAPLEFAFGYPPLWLFTLLSVYPLFRLVTPISYPKNPSALWNPYPWPGPTQFFESYRRFIPINLPVLDLITKTPIIIGDVCISIFLYKMIKSISNEKYARYAALAWLLNPYAIWISSVWGEFDAIATLFVIISLYYLINNKLNKSALMLSIGVLFKLYPLLLIPVFALIIFKQSKKIKDGLKFCLISGGTILLSVFITYVGFAAAFGQQPLSLSVQLTYNLFVKRSSPQWMGQNVVSGLTPLLVLNGLTGASNIPISPILMSAGLLLILYELWKIKKISIDGIVSFTVVSIFMIFITYTVVNPQYLTWILPLLLILASTKKSSLIKYFYWALSIIGIIFIMYSTIDLSYNISPYFVSKYLGIQISPEILALSIGIAILYAVGIKFALKSRTEPPDVRTTPNH